MPTATDTRRRHDNILDPVAIRRVLTGEARLSLLREAERRWAYRHLASRGLSNWQIARRLHCSYDTVRNIERRIDPRRRRLAPRELW